MGKRTEAMVGTNEGRDRNVVSSWGLSMTPPSRRHFSCDADKGGPVTVLSIILSL